MTSKADHKTILIAENERYLLRVLKHGLESVNRTIIVVPDGESALTHIKKTPPDILIVDSGIRPMSGEELCRRIQVEMPDRRFLTCVLTASAENEYASFAQWFTNFCMLEKPVSLHRLAYYVNRHAADAAA